MNARKLFTLGFLTLFLELVLIRYLAGNVWNLGYFPNLVLIAVFIGMGAGFVFHQRLDGKASGLAFQAAPFLLCALVAFVTFLHPTVPGFSQWQADFGGDLYFTASPARDPGANVALFGLWFTAILTTFALISQRTAKLFREFTPLRAYTLDILGSCAGILAFMLMSWLGLPAYAWFAILTALFLLAQGDEPPGLRWLSLLPLTVAVFLVSYGDTRLLADPAFNGDVIVRWSPYQKIEYVNTPALPHRIFVNGVSHQHMDTVEHIRGYSYGIPYSRPYQERALHPELPPYKSVLILGAGSGNDVTAALAAGAEHVDAVEIDPGIAELGREFNPARPYHDPRVTLTVTDGRAFLTQTRRKYDLIVFALTDSLVKVSPMSQLRLENYLFTEESVARAQRVLNEGGDLLFYNFYRQPWLRQKIELMIHDVAGVYPRELFKNYDFAMLAAGKYNSSSGSRADDSQVEISHDDWPFLYLQKKGVPGVYLGVICALALLLGGLLLAVHLYGPGTGVATGGLSTKLAFLLMGVAFLLLETKSVIQFSLLFGTTWINNSLVFLAVLLLVLAANWAAPLLRASRLPFIFGVLMASCLSTLFYPLAGLLAVENPLLRFVLAALLTFSPIFFANLLFSVAFREAALPEHVFGWNLIGATLGGVAEYSSLAIGYNRLAWLVALCYAGAFAALRHARRERPGETPGPAWPAWLSWSWLEARLPETRTVANVAIFLALFLRLVWLTDMEWKGDQFKIVGTVANLLKHPASALAPVSEHSGVAQSAGFLYFLHLISLGSRDPLMVGGSIALFNALALVLPLWLLRRSRLLVLALAMCVTSTALVFMSRQIWNPDLIIGWDCLAFALFACGLEESRGMRARQAALAAAGFSLVMAGHMYLPGGFTAAIVTVVASLWMLRHRPRRISWAWLAGCGAGWLTFVPYLYLMLTHAAGAYGPSGAELHFSYKQALPIFRTLIFLPSTFTVNSRYLSPWIDWLFTYHSGPSLFLTLFWVWAGGLVWTFLFWICVVRTLRHRAEAMKDPLVLSALALLAGTPLVLFFLRLGTYLHYWLGVIPFTFYLIAWAVNLNPGSRPTVRLVRAAWTACAISLVATLHLLLLVHQLGGLPGEYGPAYHTVGPVALEDVR